MTNREPFQGFWKYNDEDHLFVYHLSVAECVEFTDRLVTYLNVLNLPCQMKTELMSLAEFTPQWDQMAIMMDMVRLVQRLHRSSNHCLNNDFYLLQHVLRSAPSMHACVCAHLSLPEQNFKTIHYFPKLDSFINILVVYWCVVVPLCSPTTLPLTNKQFDINITT